MFDPADPDYALAWPAPIFARELDAITDRDELQWLLTEAFASGVPARDIPDLMPVARSSTVDALKSAAAAGQLRAVQAPTPYYPHRRGHAARPMVDADLGECELQRRWDLILGEFLEHGDFDSRYGTDCVDNPSRGGAGYLEEQLAQHLGLSWPLSEDLDPDLLYGAIEVAHDLIARPRSRSYHGYGGCGWHYSNHSRVTGQMPYRWRVNELLAQHRIGLQIAKSGEDVGRLVTTTSDAREDLLARITQEDSPCRGDELAHAVAQFRRRGATRADKRSACMTLARILEERRDVLRQHLLKKDEAALFQIANQFDIRHSNDQQLAVYGVEFLDWIFWAFLASVDLTEQLLAREPSS